MPLNDADKKFLMAMIPHHRQAVRMADEVIRRGLDMRVDALARGVRDTQAQEIEVMEGLLRESGETPRPGGPMGGHE